MAEFYETIERDFSTYSDRYKDCALLKDLETGESLVATREIYDIPSKSTDKYHELQSHEVGRLDLIAYKYYKNALLWWVIAQANEIYDPFEELSPGTILRIPTIETLYGNKGILL